MEYSKAKYEQLILESPLFSLDKARESSAYKREALKMVEYLYLYLLSINEEKYIDYALEITETANRCISNYDASSGCFLHYFNFAMAKEYRRASAKRQMEESRRGIHISDDDDRNIRKIVRFMESRGIHNPTEEQIDLISESLNLSASNVLEYILMNNNAKPLYDVITNDDGEESSLFDTVVSGEDKLDDIAEQKEACKAQLQKIEAEYITCQERQKPIISAMMTIKVCEIICEYQISTDGLSFVNNEIIVKFVQTGTTPTQREIAEKFGKKEASISRTISSFISKLQGV